MYKNSRILAIIPARGGSKRLPNKNILPLCGLPLIAHSIAAGRHSYIDRMVVSTDSPQIADIAAQYGCPVPFMRPAELSNDTASSVEVVLHVLDELQAQGEEYDTVVLLQPTSPLRTADMVGEAIAYYYDTQAQSVVSVCAVDHPPQWSNILPEDRAMDGFIRPEVRGLRSQDMQQHYRLNGALYISDVKTLRASKSFINDQGTRAFLMDRDVSVDIDEKTDFHIAEALMDTLAVPSVSFAGRTIGSGHPCFVIAEAGVNHNGDMEIAKKLIDAAVDAKADAVKFQTFIVDKFIARGAPKAEYQKVTTGGGSMDEMVRQWELSRSQHEELIAYCKKRGILFLSTAFDEDSLAMLVELGMPVIKMGSGEITNFLLLKAVADTGLPVILSTGMSEMHEVDAALRFLKEHNAGDVVVLHCVSNYPAAAETINIRAMETMRQAFRRPVGYSDHTKGFEVPLAAAALGASLFERHLTLSHDMEGPDHQASTEPRDFKQLVESIRIVEASLGNGVKTITPREREVRDVARRSIVAAHDLPAEHIMTMNDVAVKRPGTGMHPGRLNEVIGHRLLRDVTVDTLLGEGDFSD